MKLPSEDIDWLLTTKNSHLHGGDLNLEMYREIKDNILKGDLKRMGIVKKSNHEEIQLINLIPNVEIFSVEEYFPGLLFWKVMNFEPSTTNFLDSISHEYR